MRKSIFLALLLSGVLILSFNVLKVKAITLEEIKNQIQLLIQNLNSLINQLKQLKNKKTGSNSTSSIFSLKVIFPSGGEILTIGKPVLISWDTINLSNNTPIQIGIYNVNYSTEGGPCPEFTIVNTTNTGSYWWTPTIWEQCPLGDGYKIKIYAAGGLLGVTESKNPFMIIADNCLDSDDDNIFTKGRTIYEGKIYYDSCTRCGNLCRPLQWPCKKIYCDGVQELTCFNNNLQTTSQRCPNGYICQDGACKPSSISVDIKINDLSVATSVPYNSIFKISWKAIGGATQCVATGDPVPLIEGGIWPDLINLPPSGSRLLYAKDVSGYKSALELTINCLDTNIPEEKTDIGSNTVYVSVIPPETTFDCQTLFSTKTKIFEYCYEQGFEGVCFNKYSGEYLGCGFPNKGCTINNTNAINNIFCPIPG